MFNRACSYILKRIRTESEVRKYLFKLFGTLPEFKKVVDDVILKLIDLRYINDHQYVQIYVNSFMIKKIKSQFFLKRKLLEKGVKAEIIDSYFLNNPISDTELAIKSGKTIWSRYEKLEESVRKRRFINYLQRRGFSFEQALKSLESIRNNKEIEER